MPWDHENEDTSDVTAVIHIFSTYDEHYQIVLPPMLDDSDTTLDISLDY